MFHMRWGPGQGSWEGIFICTQTVYVFPTESTGIASKTRTRLVRNIYNYSIKRLRLHNLSPITDLHDLRISDNSVLRNNPHLP